MKYSIILFFLLFLNSSYSQDLLVDDNSTVDLSFGLEFIDFRSFEKKQGAVEVSPETTIFFGIAFNKPINNILVLKTGLRYFKSDFETKVTSNIISGISTSPIIGNSPILQQNGSSFPTENTVNLNYTFLEIPIVLRYYLSNNNIKPYMESGLNVRYLKTGIAESSQFNSVELDEKFLLRLNYLAYLSFGCEKTINKHLKIYIQASYQYIFNGNYSSDLLSNKPLDIGLEFGGRISL